MRDAPPLIYVDARVAATMPAESSEVLGRGDAGPICYVRKDVADRRVQDIRQSLNATDRIVHLATGELAGVSRLYALTARGQVWELTELGWKAFPLPDPEDLGTDPP